MGDRNSEAQLAFVEPRAAENPVDSSAAPAAAARTSFWLPMLSLCSRELVRFSRQRSRVVGMVATPLLFWIFIGSGLGSSFHPPSASADSAAGAGYLQYFFPGTIIMIVLFTSVLANMSVIEDRREGFLLSVLVAPIYRLSLVLGKVLGGTIQSVVPGILFLLIGPAVGFHLHALQLLYLSGLLFLVSFCLTCMGFFIAWQMDSAAGFHAVLNLVLIPMWLLSGSLFPASGASVWIQWTMRLNPLTYGLDALRRLLYWDAAVPDFGVAPLGLSLAVTVLFGIVTLVAALVWTGRPTTKNLG